MSDGKQLSFGIKTSQMGASYEDILGIWRQADAVPVFEHAWLWDHMVPLRGPVNAAALEAWTLLAALAVETDRLQMGVMVTSNRLRYPSVLAKMAATVDVISGGRLIFGIGAGGSEIPGADPAVMEIVHREFDAYGVPIVSAAEAVGALDEAVTVIRRLWTEDELFDFEGTHYQLRGAVSEPKPVQKPHPPILIGGGGAKKTLRVVARQADMWNSPAFTAEDFQRMNEKLDEHCAAVGRDPGEVIRSAQILIRPGDPAAARDLILQFIGVGATHLVIAPIPPFESVQWLADEIVEPVKEMAAG
jgi:alkanesulfonate monooxygenase SsuD/methylene tetrahydromethanopterin reductase-like flavin-dependent oxidoreductase (luciferase family)